MLRLHVLAPSRECPSPLVEMPSLRSLQKRVPKIVNITRCHNCKNPINSENSIQFLNRTYHSECYICSHCEVSLIDVPSYLQNQEIYCADCHYAINIELSPLSEKTESKITSLKSSKPLG
jgi:transcription elongation factor Elf1